MKTNDLKVGDWVGWKNESTFPFIVEDVYPNGKVYIRDGCHIWAAALVDSSKLKKKPERQFNLLIGGKGEKT